MNKIFGIFGTFFAVMGLFGFWTPILTKAGIDTASIAFVNLVSLWGGLALLCVAAALTLWHRRQSYYNSED